MAVYLDLVPRVAECEHEKCVGVLKTALLDILPKDEENIRQLLCILSGSPHISLKDSYTGNLSQDLSFIIERVAHEHSQTYADLIGEFLWFLVRDCSLDLQRHFISACERVFDQYINPFTTALVFDFSEVKAHDECGKSCFSFPCCTTSKCVHADTQCVLTSQPVPKSEVMSKVTALLYCVCRLIPGVSKTEKTRSHLKENVFLRLPCVYDVVKCWMLLDPHSSDLPGYLLRIVQEELRLTRDPDAVKAVFGLRGIPAVLTPCANKLIELVSWAALAHNGLTEALISLAAIVLAHSPERITSSMDLPLKPLMKLTNGPEFCAGLLKSSCLDWEKVARALESIISSNANPAKKQKQMDGSPVARLSRVPSPQDTLCQHDEAVLSLLATLLEEFKSNADESLNNFFLHIATAFNQGPADLSIRNAAIDRVCVDWRVSIKKKEIVGLVASRSALNYLFANAVVMVRVAQKPHSQEWLGEFLKEQWESLVTGQVTGSKTEVKLATRSLARVWMALEEVKDVPFGQISIDFALINDTLCPFCDSPVSSPECPVCYKPQVTQRITPPSLFPNSLTKTYLFSERKSKRKPSPGRLKAFSDEVLKHFSKTEEIMRTSECHSFLTRADVQNSFCVLTESIRMLQVKSLPALLKAAKKIAADPICFQRLVAKRICARLLSPCSEWAPEMTVEYLSAALLHFPLARVFATTKDLLEHLQRLACLPLKHAYRTLVIKAFTRVRNFLKISSAKLMLAMPPPLLYHMLGAEDTNFLVLLTRDTQDENVQVCNSVLAKALADVRMTDAAILALYYRLTRHNGRHALHVESLIAEVACSGLDFSVLEQVFQKLQYPRANLLDYIRQKGDIVRMRSVVQLVYRHGLSDEVKALWQLSDVSGLPTHADWLKETFSPAPLDSAKAALQRLHLFFNYQSADLWDETIKVAFGFEDALREDSALKSANKLVAISRLLLALPSCPFNTLKLASLAVHLQFVNMELALLCAYSLCAAASWSELSPHLDVLLALALEGRNCPLSPALVDLILKKNKKTDLDQLTVSDMLSGYYKLKRIVLNKELRPKLTLWPAVAQCVTHDVLQVQRTAIGLVGEMADLLSVEERLELLRALSSVGQRNSSLEALKEHMYEIQARIAEAYGCLGALPPSKLPGKSQVTKSRDDTVPSLISGYMNSYMQVENTFLSHLRHHLRSGALSESDAKAQGLDVLSSLVVVREPSPPNPAFGQDGLLRSWCAWLINSQGQTEFHSLLPVIEVSLDCTARTLQILLSEGMKRHGLLMEDTVRFVHELLQYASTSTKGIAIKVLEQVRSSDGSCFLTKIDPHLLVGCYCELLEFPKALYWLELQIRRRFGEAQVRMKESELTDEEFKSLQVVYLQLKEHCYLREVPEQLDYLPQNAADEVLLLHAKIASEVLSKGAYEQIDTAGGFDALEQVDSLRRPLLRKKILEHLSGCLWRQADTRALQTLISKWERDMVTLECILARTFYHYKVTESIAKAVERGKELSALMCNLSAEYPQAYDYVFLQHVLKDAQLLSLGQVRKVLERHSLLRPEFRYLETALRFSIALAQSKDDQRLLTLTLVKTAVRHRKKDYSNLLLSHICWSSSMLSDLRLVYYEMKLSLREGSSLSILRQRLERFFEAIPEGQLQLKYRGRVLLLKVVCRLTWDMPVEKVKQLKDAYLTPGEAEVKAVSVYLERGLYTLAAHLDKFLLNGKTGQQDFKALACLLYFQSLLYGQRKALRSVPRALSLFFNLNSEESEGEELKSLNQRSGELAEKLPTFVWCHVLEQLLAHATHEKECCRNFVLSVISKLTLAHTPQLSWYVLPMLFSSPERAAFAKRLLAILRLNFSAEAYSRVEASVTVLRALADLAKDPTSRRIAPGLLSDLRCSLAMPIRDNFEISAQGFPPSPVLIVRLEQYLEVIESKARPKKVKLVGSDGVSRLFLCKFESTGDMRKEARIATFIQLVNKLLRKNPQASELHLQLPSFCLLAISPMCAVIEWVAPTSTLRSIILRYWKREGFNFDITQLDKVLKGQGVLKIWETATSRIRPQLHRYFFEMCPDGNSWHECRLRYTRSLAAWSMFGYIIGLGDRHCDNILMLETGELMFIDFDCVFDMGRTLKVPEMVPFRLTPELVDGLGIFGEAGEFLHASEVMLEALKGMSLELSSAFETFIHDPLIVPIKNPELSRVDNDINNTLSIVVSRLKGQKSANDATCYPCVRMQVLDLVAKAKDEETLKRMFAGWMPWM